MNPNKNEIKYWDDKTILIINQNGSIRQLYTPFNAKCIIATDKIKANTWVFVEQVAPDKHYKILYKVIHTWFPYHHFRIIIHF